MSGPQTSLARRMLGFRLRFSNNLSMHRHLDSYKMLLQVKKKMVVVTVAVVVVTVVVMMVLTALMIMVTIVTVI